MLTLLSKLLIKAPVSDPSARRQYGLLAGALGLALNLLLFAGKLSAGLLSGSVAVLSDAFNNLSDAAGSVITVAGFSLAGQKPDSRHPYGHGRYEYITGLLVSVVILFMGCELGWGSLEKILTPEPVTVSALTAGVLVGSLFIKLYMALYNYRLGRTLDSSVMRAAARDSLGDTLATGAVLASLAVQHTLGWPLDGWCGLLVSGFILYTGVVSARETITQLLGRPPEPELVERITALTLACAPVTGLHDLVIHDYGPGRLMISLHAEVPAGEDILVLHEAIDALEKRIGDELRCSAVIHMDPVETDNHAALAARDRVAALLAALHEGLTLHDFRMVPGIEHTSLIFDVVLPHDAPFDEAALAQKIERMIPALDSSYTAVVTVDRPYL